MKKLLPLVALLVALFSCKRSLKVSLNKTWLSKDFVYMKFNDSSVFLTQYLDGAFYAYNLRGQQLNLEAKNSFRGNSDSCKFKIEKLTEDTLIVKALNDRTKERINHSDSCIFIDASKIDTIGFRFQKIFFSVKSGMALNWPTEIEVDSIGNVFFYGSPTRKKTFIDTICDTGLYQGMLKPNDLARLKYILRHAWLDNFPTKLGDACDAGSFQFTFWYGGKKRESKGSIVPYYEQGIPAFMYDITKFCELHKSNQAHNFEVDYKHLFPPPPPEILLEQLGGLKVTPPKGITP